MLGVGLGTEVCLADTDLEGATWQAVKDTVNAIVKIAATAVTIFARVELMGNSFLRRQLTFIRLPFLTVHR